MIKNYQTGKTGHGRINGIGPQKVCKIGIGKTGIIKTQILSKSDLNNFQSIIIEDILIIVC
jgi:hypothetical protein